VGHFLHVLFRRSPITSQDPTVSVVIPTYNRSTLVIEAVESVLDQSYADHELLVVDDGSTDETAERLSTYKDRMRLYRQENLGASAARNLGIRRARGRYLAFLDSDDLWLKDKLAAQMDLIERDPTVEICYTEEIWIRHGVRVNPRLKHRKHSGWILDKLLPLCIVSPSSVLIARQVLDRVGLFDESLPACEDYDLWLRIGRHYPIILIDKPLIVKRGGHADQLSMKYWGLDRYRIKAILRLLADDDLDHHVRRTAIATLQEKCRIVATGFLKRGKKELAAQFQAIAARYSPNE
jgi:glycosyltransferase involved in cell wall biosynthesis